MISTFFEAYFFFGRTNLKQIEKQEKLYGVRGHASRKFFEMCMFCNGYFSAF